MNARHPPPSLDERELEYFMRIVDTSFAIRLRSHFFLWVRGELQALVPHELLVCAVTDYEKAALRVERFAGGPLPEQHLERICAPADGLIVRVVERWSELGRPILACPGLNGFGYRLLQADLERHGLASLAAHGVFDPSGGAASCAVFIGVPGPLTPRHAYLLQLVMPYVHLALNRVIAAERRDGDAGQRPVRALSEREREVLRRIRAGKSNAEIAAELTLSPLTVKNHVQNILKKLSAQNRAQAVAFAIAKRIIPTSGE